jgi:hypothetical protein
MAQREEGGHDGRERRGECQNLPGDLLANLPGVVATLDLEVTAEQIDHRQVGGGLAVGDRGGLCDEPAVYAVRMKELPEEARLAHPWFPDHGDDLAPSQTRPIESVSEVLKLRVPADEAREPPARRGLEAGAGGAGPHQLEHLDRLCDPLDRHRAERGDLDEAFTKVERLGGEPDAAGCRELLHAGSKVRRLPHGRVVHAQVAADRADYDVAGVEADADLHLEAVSAA